GGHALQTVASRSAGLVENGHAGRSDGSGQPQRELAEQAAQNERWQQDPERLSHSAQQMVAEEEAFDRGKRPAHCVNRRFVKKCSIRKLLSLRRNAQTVKVAGRFLVISVQQST